MVAFQRKEQITFKPRTSNCRSVVVLGPKGQEGIRNSVPTGSLKRAKNSNFIFLSSFPKVKHLNLYILNSRDVPTSCV